MTLIGLGVTIPRTMARYTRFLCSIVFDSSLPSLLTGFFQLTLVLLRNTLLRLLGYLMTRSLNFFKFYSLFIKWWWPGGSPPPPIKPLWKKWACIFHSPTSVALSLNWKKKKPKLFHLLAILGFNSFLTQKILTPIICL